MGDLDTSGEVAVLRDGTWPETDYVSWSDLSLFMQGYIEALFDQYGEALTEAPEDAVPCIGATKGFTDLAPETLARIIADCGRASERLKDTTTTGGASFWRMRQRGEFIGGLFVWTPLTVQLADDGKVVFA